VTTTYDPVDLAVELHQGALSAMDARRYPETVALCRRALELFEAHAGPAHPDVANVLSLLGGAEDELGAHADAEAHHRRAVAIMAAMPSGDGVLRRLAVQARLGLGANLRRQGRCSSRARRSPPATVGDPPGALRRAAPVVSRRGGEATRRSGGPRAAGSV
jgi:hypothetical protein